jgi:PhoH-like ATPase
MAKTYVLDTSVLLSDFNSLFAFPKEEIVLPMTVLKELDGKKKGCDEVGRNARETIRILEGISSNGSLKKGIKLENESLLRVIPDKTVHRSQKESLTKDDKIINAAVWLKETEKKDVMLVSEDLNMRVIANVADLQSQAFFGFDAVPKKEETYSGSIEIQVDGGILDEFHKNKYLPSELFDEQFFPNQFVTLHCGKQSGIGLYNNKTISKLNEIKKVMHGDIKAKNREQEFALQLLLNEKIQFVTLSGPAGSGKTLLALSAALQQVEGGHYDRLIVTKPMVPMGRFGDIGALPGEKMDKIGPWMGSIFDNLRFIVGDDWAIDKLIEKGTIEFEALSLFRGRSLPNSIIIVDEAQNINRIEAKTLVTRCGYNTKMIMTNDNSQIDNPYVDSITNGAVYCIERMKDQEISGHITLTKGERSTLASIAAELL